MTDIDGERVCAFDVEFEVAGGNEAWTGTRDGDTVTMGEIEKGERDRGT